MGYDNINGTTVTYDSTFTLVALLDPKSGEYLNGKINIADDFYLTAGLVPKQLSDPGIDPAYTVASAYNFSFVKSEAGAPHTDLKDLPSHGIFDTWYWEYKFNFTEAEKVELHNAQDDVGDPILYGGSGDYLYAAYFTFDVSPFLVNVGDAVHFDLYASDKKVTGGIVKAPFSHDAEATVPEPATMLLLGTGLIGMAGIGRKKFKK